MVAAFAASAAVVGLLPLTPSALADPPTTAPAPLLDEISRETQNLFQAVRPGLVRVELPPPNFMSPLGGNTGGPMDERENPVQKWESRLNANVLQQLHAAQVRAAQGHATGVEAFVATQPAASQPADSSNPEAREKRAPRTFVVARPDGGLEFVTNGAPPYDANFAYLSVPRFLGIVLDDAGHVLIPVFVERDALEGRPLNVIDHEGKSSLAHFVGSDRQTNLTVIQLATPLGKPVSLAGDRPPDGSLVMLLSPSSDNGRLSIWTGGLQDRGLLITTSGNVGGFVRMGQFLSGDAMRPLAGELIQYGKVRRATLGVAIAQAETPDGHPAMLIEQVLDHSAASDAGLREGDFILSLAGSAVCDIPSFAAAIAQRDGPTELQLLRDGHSLTATANLKPQ